MTAAADPSATDIRLPQPLDLPRLVMRRAAAVGLGVLLLAVVLGLARMGDDIDDEVDAAMTLAAVMARLGQLGQTDDRSALESLRAMQADHPLRHLALRVHAQDGSLLLGPAPAPSEAPQLRWLLDLHRAWLSAPDARRVAWQVARADGSRWTVSLSASHDSERREAMGSFIDMLGLLLLCVGGLLAVMHWNVRHAFAPLGRLLQAIAGIEGHDVRQVLALPTMPIRELEQVAASVRHLGAALQAAEAQRRQLSQQVLTLQDDERARLARDLHDEFGQHLTALRVDAAWLARQLADDAQLKPVVEGMAAQCALVQQQIRSLLTRMQPFGPVADGPEAGESLARGTDLLKSLVASWHGDARERGLHCRIDLACFDAQGEAAGWPGDDLAQALALPRGLWLTLYRISQEALTNVARHAQAGTAGLQLHLHGDLQPGALLRIDWAVWDDGIGLPGGRQVLPRGNGLAGLQERVWAQGSELQCGPWQAGAARPGLRLCARFETRLLAPPPAAG